MGAANRSLLGIVDLREARLSVDVTDRTEAEPARILRRQLKTFDFLHRIRAVMIGRATSFSARGLCLRYAMWFGFRSGGNV
jgi:hypothetical protein